MRSNEHINRTYFNGLKYIYWNNLVTTWNNLRWPNKMVLAKIESQYGSLKAHTILLGKSVAFGHKKWTDQIQLFLNRINAGV